ncbi:MAG: ABC transporter ATP-binding protein, partial [Spirochaetaceae bacterium]|nr:ABC transporter ATP-binding protein [Spirochaetaceae bacterium]
RDLAHQRIRLGTTKWMFFQLHNSVVLGIFILLLALMVARGGLAPGYVLTYIMYFAALRTQANDFIDHIQAMIERKSNLGRMMPYFWQDHALERGNLPFPRDWDAISIRDAVFMYAKDEAIGGLCATFARGSKIGIAGRSGSGKSTLIKLLLGLYKLNSGEILVGKEKLDDIGHDELVANVAVVLQETELFNLSLRENVAMMRDVDPRLFAKAIEIACLEELVARLPAGLDAVIGERGYALSGGERQRVGIARAVCRDAPIMLLDEATSALDGATEARVMAGLLGPFARGRTVFVVAHRVSTLAGADRILVFEQGRLVEEGGYAELSADPGSRFGAMRAMDS